MNERDKELAKQAWAENDWDGHVDIPKLIQLVRADAMEAATRAANESWTLACKKMVEFEREACAEVVDKRLKTWASLAGKDKAYRWLEKLSAAIRAKEVLK
jgi:hypothetical protein